VIQKETGVETAEKVIIAIIYGERNKKRRRRQAKR